ncbi:MAG: DNA translocase FtsK, partial [Myxococcota bacterium]
SISALQRRLRVGYNRAARMIEMMEKQGIVGPATGPKGEREILAEKID